MISLRLRCWGIMSSELAAAGAALEDNLCRMMLPWRSALEPVNWNAFYRDKGISFSVADIEIVLFSVTDFLTVYLCNGDDGWISLFETVVANARFTAWFFRTSIGVATYPVYEMMYWRSGIRNRHIRVLKDGERWTYLSTGSPLQFEDQKRYKARSIQQRAIESYSRTLGFDVLSITQIAAPLLHFRREQL
jgi:hypothetical protein